MSIKKYIPNILSTIRLAMAFALPFVFLNTSLLNTLIFYLVGDATDAVDGFLARKWKVQSKYGKFVDPIADKMLNGLTLLLTSILVNPLMFILTGFEALIAATNLVRIKKKRDINVAIIGKVKTVVLFFTTVLSLLTPMMPGLKIASTTLIGITAVLQSITAAKYLHEYHKESKEDKKANDSLENTPFQSPIEAEEDPIKKLEYAKKRLNTYANKNNMQSLPPIMPNQIVVNDEDYDPETLSDDEMGIARTLKK